MIIAAQSGNLFAQTAIEIQIRDINDNMPKFIIDTYHWRVREDAPIGKVLATLIATDADSNQFGAIYYHLVNDGESMNDVFSVGLDDGKFRIKSSLDRELIDTHRYDNYNELITISTKFIIEYM